MTRGISAVEKKLETAYILSCLTSCNPDARSNSHHATGDAGSGMLSPTTTYSSSVSATGNGTFMGKYSTQVFQDRAMDVSENRLHARSRVDGSNQTCKLQHGREQRQLLNVRGLSVSRVYLGHGKEIEEGTTR